MVQTGTPLFAWAFVVVLGTLIGMLTIVLLAERFVRHPIRTLDVGETTVELWVRERAYPARTEAIVVPVAPDLAMTTGIAKWVRDTTGNRLQDAAQKVAPLRPGECFVAAGGKFRFEAAALAVVMDDSRQVRPEWITASLAAAITQCRSLGARTVIVPDMTPDLLRQNQTITDEQFASSAVPVAKAILQAVRETAGEMDRVRIWVWRPQSRAVFIAEMDRLTTSTAVVPYAVQG